MIGKFSFRCNSYSTVPQHCVTLWKYSGLSSLCVGAVCGLKELENVFFENLQLRELQRLEELPGQGAQRVPGKISAN